MSKSIVLIFFSLFSILKAERLADYTNCKSEECFNQSCEKYLSKFNIKNNGASKIAFSGEATFIGNTSNVEVKLRYSDVEYFNDPNFWGLVQEDGKTPETTCLDMKLYKFPSSDYQNAIQITDLTITPSNNSLKQWRYYSFTIKANDFQTKLTQTANSNYYVYKGYYEIAFYAADTEYLQYPFYFDFTVIVDKFNGVAVETAFRSQIHFYSCPLDAVCLTITALTSIKWCTDFTCLSFSQPDLHFNDQFVLQQVTTTSGLTGFYLTNTVVWYTGHGLNKKATILQIDNSVAGSVKILLKADIVWRNVTIIVDSVLSNNVNGTRRLLTQTTFDTVSGQTAEITCIKAENSDTCPDCQQQCEVNGFGQEDCSVCISQNFIFSVVFSFLSVILF